MKSAVTLSLVPEAKGGPFVFWDGLADGCKRAAALGFDAVEIFPPSAGAIDKLEVRHVLDKHGLRLAAMGTGGGWVLQKLTLTHADAGIRAKAKQFIRDIIDLAGEFQAPAIVGSMQGRWEAAVSRPQALVWLSEALEEFGQHAASKGQMLLYEPLNRYETNLFNRCGDAADFLKKLSAGNIKLLADLFHMNIEERSVPDALRDAASYIGHVHFADSNRRAVGMGHTNVARIIEALSDFGYDGYLSAEILPFPDSDAAASQTIDSFKNYTA
jgi:sugar phosphate isomerase/epimerase